MTAPPPSGTTALAPGQSAPPIARARACALLAALRDSLAGAREAVGRMHKLIDAAQLDRPDQ